jgi:hypothetical protein
MGVSEEEKRKKAANSSEVGGNQIGCWVNNGSPGDHVVFGLI